MNRSASNAKNAASAGKRERQNTFFSRNFLFRQLQAREQLSFAIISALWVLALYYPVLQAPFVYDDVDSILRNPWLGSFHSALYFFHSSVNFANDLLHSGQTFYRPLFWMSLGLDRWIWGLDHPGGFHLTNLLLHWINGLLGFLLLRRLRVSLWIAICTVLIWLGLPIHSEVVAWISGRTYSLALCLMLAALLLGQSYITSGRARMLIGFNVLSFLALLCHEEAVLIVPFIVLIAYATGCLISGRLAALLGTIAGPYLMYFYLRHVTHAHLLTASLQIWPVGIAFFKYLKWLLFPLYMSVERSTDMPANHFSLWTCAGLLGVICLIIFTLWLRNRLPQAASGLAWLFIGLIPFCGVIFIYQGMAERYEYIASAGMCLFLSATLFTVKNQRYQRVLTSLFLVWVLWGAWRIHDRDMDWRSPARLYAESLRATPNSPKLLYDLGAVSEQQNDLNTAKTSYEKAVALEPEYEPAIAGLGNVYLRLSDFKQAQSYYVQAIHLNPRDVKTMMNLALAMQAMGDPGGAEQQYRRIITDFPNEEDAYCNFGALLFQQHRDSEAITALSKAIAVNPNDPTAYYDLGAIYQSNGKPEVALSFYKKALVLNPSDIELLGRIRQLESEKN